MFQFYWWMFVASGNERTLSIQYNILILRAWNECASNKCQLRSIVPFTRCTQWRYRHTRQNPIYVTDRLEQCAKNEAQWGNFEEWSHPNMCGDLCLRLTPNIQIGLVLDWDDVISYGHFLPLGASKNQTNKLLYAGRVAFETEITLPMAYTSLASQMHPRQVWKCCSKRTTILNSTNNPTA